MNRENLDKLISNYIANFDLINNDVNMEYYKWEAVKHFQDHWNIDAPDFAAMFREAIRLTYNLINNINICDRLIKVNTILNKHIINVIVYYIVCNI